MPRLNPSRLRKWAYITSEPFHGFLFAGIVAALCEAVVWPAVGIAFSQAAALIINPQHKADELAVWCGVYVVIGAINGVGTFFRLLFTHLAGSRLTLQLRLIVFQCILSQKATWFDEKLHNQGEDCHCC